MEIEKKDEGCEETKVPETPVEGETPEGEEVEKMSTLIEKKLETLMKQIKDNPAEKSFNYKESPTLTRSVMETDPMMRRIRPFVKLSPTMEQFVKDIKAIAKGEVTKSALNEGSTTSGGYTVPEEFNSEVIRYETEASVVRPRARVWNMTREKWYAPKLDQNTTTDSANTGAIDFAGIMFYYPGESGLKVESEPRFGRVLLTAQKLIGLTAITDELLEDSAVNLANYLVSLFGEGLAYFEDYKFFNGSGTDEPLGLITCTTITSVARKTSTRILVEDIFAMDKNLPAWADRNAVFITTKAGIEQLRLISIESTTSKVVFQENLREGQPSTLMGKPVIVTDKIPAVGTRGDIILADLSKYYIGDRGALQVASSIHDRFRYDETVFRVVKRHDGQPAIPQAFVVLGA